MSGCETTVSDKLVLFVWLLIRLSITCILPEARAYDWVRPATKRAARPVRRAAGSIARNRSTYQTGKPWEADKREARSATGRSAATACRLRTRPDGTSESPPARGDRSRGQSPRRGGGVVRDRIANANRSCTARIPLPDRDEFAHCLDALHGAFCEMLRSRRFTCGCISRPP